MTRKPAEITQTAGRGHITKEEFGRRLKHAMLQKGWNQSEMARQASKFLAKEMGRDSVSVYVRGHHFPESTHLYALARALDIEAAELLPNIVPESGHARGGIDVSGVPGMPGKMRLRIDQEVTMDQAVKIMQILKDENGG